MASSIGSSFTVDRHRDVQIIANAVLGMFAVSMGAYLAFAYIGWALEPAKMIIRMSKLLDIATLIVVIPVLEELVFRGLVLDAVRDRIGFWPASIVSSGLFCAIHTPLTYHGVFVYMGIGIILSLVKLKTDRLLPCILAHAGYNMLPAAFVLIYLR